MRERTGKFLERLGILSRDEVVEILAHSRKMNMTFGEAAVRLGRLKNQSPLKIRYKSLAWDFFHLVPEYFPLETKDLFTSEQVIKYGVLPLGTKKGTSFFKSSKVINLGYIDPTNQKSMEEVESQLLQRGEYQNIHRYLILMEEFLSILSKYYGTEEEELSNLPPDALEPTLALYLKEPTAILELPK